MKSKSLLIRYMGDTPKLRIIDFFLDNMESDYSKKEIMENTGISKTTLDKVWDEILEFEYLKTTRRYGKAQLYAINPKSELIQRFKELDLELCKQVMNKATKEPTPA